MYFMWDLLAVIKVFVNNIRFEKCKPMSGIYNESKVCLKAIG